MTATRKPIMRQGHDSPTAGASFESATLNDTHQTRFPPFYYYITCCNLILCWLNQGTAVACVENYIKHFLEWFSQCS